MTMTSYIGVKSIEAKPMTFGEYRNHRGWTVPEGMDPDKAGYLVRYTDGYESWSPKEAFEAAYFPVTLPNKLVPADIDLFLGDKVDALKVGDKSVLVSIKYPSGFVDHEVSSCVDPANYDEEIGKRVAIGHIKDRLWGHLGFVLQWARYGLKQS